MVSTQWSHSTKRLVVIGLIIVFLIGLYVFRALIPPVAIAFVLAYLLKPIADWVERRTHLPRTLAVLVVYAVLLLIGATIPATVVPRVVDQVNRLNVNLQQLIDDLASFLSQPFTIFAFTFNLGELFGDLRGTLQELLQPFATQTFTILFGVASSLLWVLSILVISFYLVRDAGRLRAFLDRSAPPQYTEELRLLREEINEVWKAFFRGQLVLGLVVGLTVWILMSLVGLPNAGLMGLIAGVLEVVPTFGPILATIPALLVALFQGSTYLPLSNFWFAVVVVGIYLMIQQVENAYLQPRIMGTRLRLHPLVVFIGVLAGGLLAGILGVFLAAPVIGTVRVLLDYVYAKLIGEVPFPREEAVRRDVYPGEIDAVLFDLDGTLIETDDEATEILARRLMPVRWLLPQRDPARIARRFLMACEGPTTRILALADRLGLDDDLFGLADRLRRLRGLHDPLHFRPVDGTPDMLRKLSRRYYLGIVTTRSNREAQAFLMQQKLTDIVQVVAGRDDTWRIKPHPSPVLHSAEQLGVPVERCLVVGDSPVDVEAARAAGAWSVGVLSGFGIREELEHAGAHRIVKVATDLLNWL
jgi:HAD superfamily hydrolase (TIGR01549 family)